jgi:hypothetical protein
MGVENTMIKNKEYNGSSDVLGKVIVGYQGWFNCLGDGSPINGWKHWSRVKSPSPGFQSFDLYPDVREYEKKYETGYSSLGNGMPAELFSSSDISTVQTHFKWMREYGIDGCALQRFINELETPEKKCVCDLGAINVKNASEENDRKFYIMYDISGMKEAPLVEKLKGDWQETILSSMDLTSSPAYARHNGKPVVCIWGFGFTDRPGTVEQCIEIVKFFKEQGCYVIGGVPYYWRECGEDSKKEFAEAYKSFDMVSPWAVGRFKLIDGADKAKVNLVDDFEYCKGNGIDYQPVVFPGFAWSNWNFGEPNMMPRLHGDFMWRQFANICASGILSAYVAMFDEYDEGTAIAKAAEDKSMIPKDQYFLTLDADGVRCSSDFYLRLTRDGTKLIKKQVPLVWDHPTGHEQD